MSCSKLIEALNFTEGVDWVRVCLGGSAFYRGIDDLSEWRNFQLYGAQNITAAPGDVYSPAHYCDFYASGIAAYSDRAERLGLQFTRPIFRSSVAAVVYAPAKVRCLKHASLPVHWASIT